MIARLLQGGAKPYFEDREGYAPLIRNMLDTTTGVSDIEYVNLYLQNGLNPNHLYPVIDQGLIHWAIEKDREDIFDTVMEYKPDLELLDRAGRTPLYVAMESRNGILANKLLKAGASANGHRIFKGDPAVYETMLNGAVRRLDIYNTTLFLKYGAKVGATGFSPDGSTALYNLCRLKVTPAQVNSQKEIFDTLIMAGANPNTPVALGKGDFPLHAAASQNNVMLVSKLLELGASVNAKSATSQTPLHIAAITGDVKLVRLLLAKGASKLIADDAGKTAGRIAFEAGDLELAEELGYNS
jgi:ankyrin repeat protein